MCVLRRRVWSARHPGAARGDHGASVEELARRRGVQPVASAEDMARPGLFDSDQEWNEFLADLYASRRADLA